MVATTTSVDHWTAAEVLHECARRRNLSEGKRMHSLLIASGQDQDSHLSNLLITMYGKCRLVEEARAVFEKVFEKNIRTWNVIISAYAQNGYHEEAVKLFNMMSQDGMEPDNFTFSAVLSAYTRLEDFSEGKKVHKRVANLGFMSDVIIATSLVNLYGRCGSVVDAREVFESSVVEAREEESIGLWTSMIAAYIDHGRNSDAIQLFAKMLQHGVLPNPQTYVTVLNACGAVRALEHGKVVHLCVENEGLEVDTIVGTALVSMYGRCNSSGDASRVFEKLREKDLVTWNAMLAAYAQEMEGCSGAFNLFQRMQLEGVKPDKFSLTTLAVCITALKQVDLIDFVLRESVLEQDLFLANTLVTMYGKHGCMDGAKKTFDKMEHRDVISWTSLIGAYVQNNFFLTALELYHEMNLEGFKPNEVTYVSALDACLNLGYLEQGRVIHATIANSSVKLDCFLETAIVNMYGKCGSLERAREMFERMQERDIVTWTSIIGSHAQHGKGKEATEFFQRMELEGMIPNSVTFVIFITACSHAGLIEEALIYFSSMTSDYSILPEAQHCLCIIDLLSRSGRVEEAEKFIENMPFRPDAIAWTTLLAACKSTGEAHRGAVNAKDLFEEDHKDDQCGPYVMLETALKSS